MPSLKNRLGLLLAADGVAAGIIGSIGERLVFL